MNTLFHVLLQIVFFVIGAAVGLFGGLVTTSLVFVLLLFSPYPELGVNLLVISSLIGAGIGGFVGVNIGKDYLENVKYWPVPLQYLSFLIIPLIFLAIVGYVYVIGFDQTIPGMNKNSNSELNKPQIISAKISEDIPIDTLVIESRVKGIKDWPYELRVYVRLSSYEATTQLISMPITFEEDNIETKVVNLDYQKVIDFYRLTVLNDPQNADVGVIDQTFIFEVELYSKGKSFGSVDLYEFSYPLSFSIKGDQYLPYNF